MVIILSSLPAIPLALAGVVAPLALGEILRAAPAIPPTPTVKKKGHFIKVIFSKAIVVF